MSKEQKSETILKIKRIIYWPVRLAKLAVRLLLQILRFPVNFVRFFLRRSNPVNSFIWEMIFLVFLIVISLRARKKRSETIIGFGPEPLINNLYHVKAVRMQGYRAESFTYWQFFLNKPEEYDHFLTAKNRIEKFAWPVYVYKFAVYRYPVLQIYFNGGPLWSTRFLWKLEPWLLKLAGVKTILMAYGGDVDAMDRCPNLLYKHAMSMDYPQFKLRKKRVSEQIDLWTRHADHILAGADWVYYLYHWDTLQSGHFSIDMEKLDQIRQEAAPEPNPEGKLRILHAPNHRTIKGTSQLLQAAANVQAEGYPIELVTIEKMPNAELLKKMAAVDVVADQFVVGWYAMFAIEGMAMGKPVLCYLRDDLLQLYKVFLGLESLPLLNTSPDKIEERLRWLCENRDKLPAIGEAGVKFVKENHSLEHIGSVFSQIYRKLGIKPDNEK